jgi:O-acetyl-ADP-ribose deacetylase (regulator of RNase III)
VDRGALDLDRELDQSSSGMSYRLGDTEVTLLSGDITTLRVDAIVNAANERMLGGAGVDGAIHRAAGPGLVEACREVPEVRPGVRCPTGEARITPGFRLPARHVIHTVGPVYESAAVSGPLLDRAYRSCLALANEHGLKSVAFPALSCGAFRYPLLDAARIALTAVRDDHGQLADIRFALFGAPVMAAFTAAAKEVFA